MVGADVRGKRVLILDDVMTAGTALRQSIELIRKEGGTTVGVVLLLDREETSPSGQSTVKDVESILGGDAKVKSIVRMRDLIVWLENNGQLEELKSMREYYSQYGIKESVAV
jgi:orotate phosphoribosyltransferase